jgi:hypothetical protein
VVNVAARRSGPMVARLTSMNAGSIALPSLSWLLRR